MNVWAGVFFLIFTFVLHNMKSSSTDVKQKGNKSKLTTRYKIKKKEKKHMLHRTEKNIGEIFLVQWRFSYLLSFRNIYTYMYKYVYIHTCINMYI